MSLAVPTLTQAKSNAVIWEHNDEIVQLAPQDDKSAPPNNQPVTMAPTDIETMLSALRVSQVDDDSGSTSFPVFTRTEIANLGAAVSQGLSIAEPSQDIIFATIGNHKLSPGAFLSRSRVTTGRIFHKDGKLNVIFGGIQTPRRKKNVYGKIDEDFYPRNYGSRSSAVETEVVILTSASTTLHQSTAGVRADWVLIDPEALAQADASPPTASTGSAAFAETGRTIEPETPPPAAPSRTTTLDSGERSGPSENPPVAPQSTAASDIERRLEKLKRLREKDLISEDAYRTKVDEILREL